jgi:nitrogen fixation NifU-like protein
MNLYGEIILDHFKNPQNYGLLADGEIGAQDSNPLCGDKLEINCKLDEKSAVSEIGFVGSGCAISIASASILTELVKGKTTDQIAALTPQDLYAELGVEISPGRSKCALLSLNTIKKMLSNHELH